MLNVKSFLAVDFGAGSLKLAEFEVSEAGGLRLKQYATKSLGAAGAQESTREAAISKALAELLAERGVKSKDLNVCAPGFHVFSKFVKLPPVDAGKVTQIIQYEAQQNVPFPLEEVVWDYQILGSAASGELEVLLVAIKADIVEGLFRITDAAGLRLQLCDVSPAALCNAFRFNYGDLEDCTMLLDIGAKTSNLLFFEKGKVYSRSINLGANSITQDFANESKLKYDAAEKIKIEEGFVSLGGAYEEPENAHQAAISKIARQFMTRLHIQVNQTMQFYRGQQGGSAPQRLFLSGGASIMPYTAQFFAEKLNVPVEYFNPFRNVQIDPSVNLEDLARVAHSLGEVVGLGLRNLAHCPIELNLMPESTLKWQSFNQRKPYFIATVFSLVAVIAALGFFFKKLADVKEDEITQKVEPSLKPLQEREVRFKRAHGDLKRTQQELDQLIEWIEDRYHWAEVFGELRRVMIRTEDIARRRLGSDAGIWIEQFTSTRPRMEFGEAGMYGEPGAGQMYRAGMVDSEEEHAFRQRYGLEGPMYPPAEQPMDGMMPEMVPGDPMAQPAADQGATNQVTILCRAVNLSHVSASANTDIAHALMNELRNSTNLFEPENTHFSGQIENDEPTGTFTFGVSLALKRSLKQ
jgi:type IV pilus assembly protein PilM